MTQVRELLTSGDVTNKNFIDIISLYVKGELQDADKEFLESRENLELLRMGLVALKKNIEAQLSSYKYRNRKPDEPASKIEEERGWKARTHYFLNSVETHLLSVKRMISNSRHSADEAIDREAIQDLLLSIEIQRDSLDDSGYELSSEDKKVFSQAKALRSAMHG